MQKPFGTWPSPISAATVAGQGLRFGGVASDGEDIYWLEGRPADGGRNVVVLCRPDGSTRDVIPPGFNARTRVHEYGGGAFAVSDGDVYFSNFDDQRLYRIARSAETPLPLTPASAHRYADFAVDLRRRRLIAVREDHSGAGEPVNTLVSIPLDRESAGEVIAEGYHFYSTPRLSPDGRQLSWLAWRHPKMPWDGTELWTADVTASGALANETRVAGSPSESIYQPGWSPDGTLYYVSDGDGWWRLYRSDRSGRSGRPVVVDPPSDAEFGRPQWVFGTATWSFAGPSRIVASYTQQGRWHLALIDVATGAWSRVAHDLEPRDWLATTDTHALLIAASPTMAEAVVRIDLASGAHDILRRSSPLTLDAADISVAQPIEVAENDGESIHAFYYAPLNSRYHAPEGERPPLIAIGHGGPTTATIGTLDLRIQYWTTRGFAVVDVNYRGSSGYGRPYRQRLQGQWGILDVADMTAAAHHLVTAGKADPHRLIIRGGSAGGYTALAALTFHPGVFNAAASYYGISDIEVLAHDTHKFESRYLDALVGPYPEMRDVYRARSPIHFVDRIACPLILFQGLDDKVVPPNQSEQMAEALRTNGLPVEYIAFEGEQHGFRKAETVVRCLEAELAFYARVFGFAADSAEARRSNA